MSDEKGDFSGAGLDNRYFDSDIAAHPTDAKARYHFDQSDLDRVQRRLKQRHVQMFVPFSHASVVHLYDSWSFLQDRRECPLVFTTASFVPMIL